MMIQMLRSLGAFWTINWLIFAVVLLISYRYLEGKRWLVCAGIFYSAVMTVKGLGHLAATLLAGRYFSGFTGAVCNCGYIVTGPVLAFCLTIEQRHSAPVAAP